MNTMKLPIGIIAAGAIIALAIYFSAPQLAPTAHLEQLKPTGAQDHVLGNPAAPIFLVAYLDPNNSYSAVAYETLRQLVLNEGAKGAVAFVYRYFPADNMAAARAQECAATVGGAARFWDFTTALYQEDAPDEGTFGSIANTLNIPGAFASCYANADQGTIQEHITLDVQNAKAIGALEAPVVLLVPQGGVPQILDPLLPYDDMRTAVSAALKTYSSTNPSR